MDIIFVIMCIVALVVGEQGDNTGDVFLLYTDVIQNTVGTMSVDGSGKENCLPSGTFNHPISITYDQNSNTVYLVNNPRDVYKFTLEGQSSQELLYRDTSGYLSALAFDGEGHIFITDLINDKITRINVNGTDPVDWVTGVDASWSVVADTTDRHLIWTDRNAHTISRTSLDDPLSTVTVIIQNTRDPTGLHIDTQLGKLFWCESSGRVLTANTDGSDAEVIVDIALFYLRGITSYGGHLYVTDIGSPYTVYDIYNGSYTAIFNSTTSRPYYITVVNNHIPGTVCKVNCYNGGTLLETNRICDCVHPWTGMECTDCDITCQNEGTLDADTCTCNCLPQWSGDQCATCNITCENEATLDVNTCTCDCLSQWRGDRCEVLCDKTCQNNGTLEADKCICNCLQQWNGDVCETCSITCQNGGTLSAGTCTCNCLPKWNGDRCDNCDITCQNGGTLNADACICDCSPHWSGDQCENCDITCQNGGTLNADTCICDCSSHWSGDQCENCDITCQNGGTLDADACICYCSPHWSGDMCENCDIACLHGSTFDAGTCICDCLPHWSGDQCENERTTQKHLTTEVTTDRLVETTGQSFETLETRNPFFEPSVMWPIIGAAVLIVLIIAVTVIVITVIRHKRANSERVAGTPAQQVDNELKDISGKSPTNETHDSESRDIEHQYQAIGDTNDLQNTVTRKTEYENTGIYEDTMANTYEKPDPAGREQYVNTAMYQSLDEY